MFPFITRALTPTTDNEQETRKHLLWWILIRVSLFSLIISVTSFLHVRGYSVILPPFPMTIAFLLGLYCFSIGSAIFLKIKFWPVRRFGLIQLFADTVFTCLLVYTTGCSQSIFTPMLILPVIVGGLILHRIGGLTLAAATTLLYGAVLGSEQLGWIPEYFFAAAHNRTPTTFFIGTNLFAIYGLIFFMVALLSGQLARRLRFTEKKLSKTTFEYDRLSILYKQIFDDISTGIITTDHGNFITSCNRAAEQITAYPLDTILGQPFNRCFPDIILQENQGHCVCDFQRKNGSQIRIGYCFSHLNMPLAEDLEEQPARCKVITLQDISQIERMEQQVREAEKMAAIGELSASIAHDFRNPLAAISGSAQILALEQTNIANLDQATFKTLLSIILRETNRMAKTITDFLQFARPAPIRPEWFNVSSLVSEVIAKLLAGTNTSATAGIMKEIDEHLDCWADRQQIQTILNHLLENACVAVGAQQYGIVVACHEINDNNQGAVCLEVRDQGPGIPVELRDKVFTPFFSSRADGTGLGLAIVRQIVENHNGSIEIDSNAVYSCIMRIHLPLAQAAHH